MITKRQVQKLKATGRVDEVEDDGMDDGRFFVHLTGEYTWNEGYGVQHSKSFGGFAEAYRAVKTNPTRLV